jgi:hypothetical protein
MSRWIPAVLAVLAVVVIAVLGVSELAAETRRVGGSPSYMLMLVSLIALIMLVMSDQRPQL